jgi:23S rRNA pseudouridine2605 synthase
MERIVLQKFLSNAGVSSRRKAEDLIKSGRVLINGKIETKLGTRVDPKTDKVFLDKKEIHTTERMVYFLFNKPKGLITALEDQRGKKTIFSIFKSKERVVPVGRLDINTTGLLILTNDGDLVYRLTHPKFEHEKEYEVFVSVPSWWKKEDFDFAIKRLEKGVKISSGKTRPAKIQVLGKARKSHYKFSITIHEGKKHQVRQMINSVGASVLGLRRVRMGPIKLGDLKEGEFRKLTDKEISLLKK